MRHRTECALPTARVTPGVCSVSCTLCPSSTAAGPRLCWLLPSWDQCIGLSCAMSCPTSTFAGLPELPALLPFLVSLQVGALLLLCQPLPQCITLRHQTTSTIPTSPHAVCQLLCYCTHTEFPTMGQGIPREQAEVMPCSEKACHSTPSADAARPPSVRRHAGLSDGHAVWHLLLPSRPAHVKPCWIENEVPRPLSPVAFCLPKPVVMACFKTTMGFLLIYRRMTTTANSNVSREPGYIHGMLSTSNSLSCSPKFP